MTRILLVRHGETDWNRIGLYQGTTGAPLNARGRRQAAALGWIEPETGRIPAFRPST